mmetsp:Transcript_11145/g.20167  ORF Transcript_11145/g.20167 Transcript_11145/m.20167 type:complete len:289 (-) Transcript_11145:489-1355(-)
MLFQGRANISKTYLPDIPRPHGTTVTQTSTLLRIAERKVEHCSRRSPLLFVCVATMQYARIEENGIALFQQGQTTFGIRELLILHLTVIEFGPLFLRMRSQKKRRRSHRFRDVLQREEYHVQRGLVPMGQIRMDLLPVGTRIRNHRREFVKLPVVAHQLLVNRTQRAFLSENVSQHVEGDIVLVLFPRYEAQQQIAPILPTVLDSVVILRQSRVFRRLDVRQFLLAQHVHPHSIARFPVQDVVDSHHSILGHDFRLLDGETLRWGSGVSLPGAEAAAPFHGHLLDFFR